MHNQPPSSINQLMLHLSRKYTQATLDSPRRNLDLSGLDPGSSEICEEKMGHLHYSPIQNSYFSEAYLIEDQKQKIRTPKQRQNIERNSKIEDNNCSPKNVEATDGQMEGYARKLQKMNRMLKSQLIAVRQLMREQSDLIHELYSNRR